MAKSRIWVTAALVAVLVAMIIAPMTAAAAPEQWGGSGCRVWHTVYYGQTMGSIARYYGTTVWAIANANGIANPNHIRSGRSLCIPYGSAGYDHGKNYYGGCWYKIRAGDTLSNIAWRYGTSASHLKAMNGYSSADWIYSGHWMRVPCYQSGHPCGGSYCY